LGNSRISDTDLAFLIQKHGPTKAAKQTGLSLRNVNTRRKTIERRLGIKISTPSGESKSRQSVYPGRIETTLQDGIILVGGDAHYWPGHPSTGHRAFVKFIKKLKPKIVVVNGDVFDGAAVSRHPSVNWDQNPTVVEELETCQARMHEISRAAGLKSRLFWTLGNHDARFEARLVQVAPEYAGVRGTSLKDHFSDRWQPCWSLFINDELVVKHRYRSGAHATHNNALSSGKSIITNHLHSAKVTPYTDYNGTRYGVDTGCLADLTGRQFTYGEDNPTNHRSGFAVITIRKGRLLYPELVLVVDATTVQFRGELFKV
jgi:hypothetical protein